MKIYVNGIVLKTRLVLIYAVRHLLHDNYHSKSITVRLLSRLNHAYNELINPAGRAFVIQSVLHSNGLSFFIDRSKSFEVGQNN